MDDRIKNLACAHGAIHPAPTQFSADQLADDPILHFFHYAHLPAALQTTSAPFCGLAAHLVDTLPRNAERSVALRKLLEAKDAAVRANVGAVASKDDWLARLKSERTELRGRFTRLTTFIEQVRTGEVDRPADLDLLNGQQAAMADYLGILEARIENAEIARQGGRAEGEIAEIGGFDKDRDGDPPFKG